MTTLLVVDKEANTRLLFKDEFQGEGYEVVVAETTEEALGEIYRSEPDIVTLNLKVPGAEGIELLRKIKQEGSGVPVVVTSACAGYKNDIRLGNCDAFVVQSADLTELKTRIKLLLSNKQPDAGRFNFFTVDQLTNY